MEKLSFFAPSAAIGSLQLEAYRFYYSLTRTAEVASTSSQAAEPNLGGNLLYAGELDPRTCASVIAGNVAGCATLSATADLAAQKQAIREGIVDFLVTSLDEALRILKNEIRKKATVAVCVGLAPSDVERQMLERGVLPDLVFSVRGGEHTAMQFGFNSREIQLVPPDRNQALLEWHVAQAPLRWMTKLDAIALECLQSDLWAHRWIRLSPRYLGRSAQGQRTLYCDSESANSIVERFGAAVQSGAIGTEVSASLMIGGETKVFRLSSNGSAWIRC